MDRERRLNLVIAGLVLVLVFAVPYLAVKSNALGFLLDLGDSPADVDCEEFEFSREDWTGTDDAHEEQVNGLDRCRILEGLSRDEVSAMLDTENSRHANPDRWVYSGGWANDYLGPGDGVTFNVYFNRDGTVTGTRLSQALD